MGGVEQEAGLGYTALEEDDDYRLLEEAWQEEELNNITWHREDSHRHLILLSLSI